MLHTLLSYLNEFLGTAITVIVGFAYVQIKKHIHLKIKKQYAQLAISFAKQAYSDLDGNARFDKASEWMVRQLSHLKIKTNKDEVEGIVKGEYGFIKDATAKAIKEEAKKEAQVVAPVSPTPQPAPVVEQPKQ